LSNEKDAEKGIKCNIKSKLNIQNIGTKDAISSVVRFYLSDNDAYDAGDIFLKKVSTGKLKVGKSTNKAFAFNFKIGSSATGKYVIAVLDADNKVVEAAEGNNSIVYGTIP
jgi:subtilase family serine protease